MLQNSPLMMNQVIPASRFAEIESRLLRDHKNLTNLLAGFECPEKPKYLLQAIANLEQRISSIRSKVNS